MQQTQKNMMAALVKEGRMAKGYTQKELSELSNISIRSIQRIENAKLVPRAYTLRTLAGVLDVSFEEMIKNNPETTAEAPETTIVQNRVLNKTQRVILSAGICLAIVFMAAAYVAQSRRFPETQFELIVFIAAIVLLLTTALFFIWNTRR
jgi:transcriptional regulator with XRE-family HTH domain